MIVKQIDKWKLWSDLAAKQTGRTGKITNKSSKKQQQINKQIYLSFGNYLILTFSNKRYVTKILERYEYVYVEYLQKNIYVESSNEVYVPVCMHQISAA